MKYSFSGKKSLKKIVRSFVRGNWSLFSHSLRVEPISYIQEKGLFRSTRICNICGFRGQFVHLYDSLRISWNSACPKCDSRSRHRGLFYLYREVLKQLSREAKVLHFAPEPIFYPIFKLNDNLDYNTTDYYLADVDYPDEDIQKLSFKEESYDLVLCNHVIEHVPDDAAAFNEINRILKKSGRALITIPGDFNKRNTVFFETLENNGHYRDYGLDVIEKMKNYFASVEAVDLSTFDGVNGYANAIRKNDLVFICGKE